MPPVHFILNNCDRAWKMVKQCGLRTSAASIPYTQPVPLASVVASGTLLQPHGAGVKNVG